MTEIQGIKKRLDRIYGEKNGARALEKILPLIRAFPRRQASGREFFSEKDVVLITYGDTLNQADEAPLATLRGFAEGYLKGIVSTIHFLPFFPYSSDDGFSVTDFFSIDPALGSWEDVNAFQPHFDLMFDYVLNHVSARSQWFRYFLEGRPGFDRLAIVVDPETDLSMVTRPRSLPLLTGFKKTSGETVHVWTTFSEDQIDLNYQSIDVLVKMIEVLLFYVEQGATILRQDAIAYLWKEIGTSCIHLSSTHEMVKLFRCILDLVAPEVMILTETNVPHAENISYFGNGYDEAQMVYNFTLPPLLLYSFVRQDATILSIWAGGLQPKSDRTTFFNFTASHDGIGVRPLEDILPAAEIEQLAAKTSAAGGQVSCRTNQDGTDSPYELNITYTDALSGGNDPVSCFLASQAIQYALPGVPATYIHSLLGSRNWVEGVRQTGRARSINREKLQLGKVLSELADPASFRSRIFFPYRDMIRIRIRQPALHPAAACDIIDLGPRVFAVKRTAPEQTLYSVTNVSSEPVTVSVGGIGAARRLKDLIRSKTVSAAACTLAPYQFRWLVDD